MSGNIPTTEEMRNAHGWFVGGILDRIDPEGLAEFDLWLAAHDAAAAARITELEESVRLWHEDSDRLGRLLHEARAQIARLEAECAIHSGAPVTHPEPESDTSHVDDEDPNAPEVMPWRELRGSAGAEGRWSKSRAFAADEVLAVVVPEFVDPEPYVIRGRLRPDRRFERQVWGSEHRPRSAAEYEADQNR